MHDSTVVDRSSDFCSALVNGEGVNHFDNDGFSRCLGDGDERSGWLSVVVVVVVVEKRFAVGVSVNEGNKQ